MPAIRIGHRPKVGRFEVAGDELRSVVGDDAGMRAGILFAGALQDDLDVNLFHRFANFPMHDRPTAAVQNAAHVIKRTGEIEITDVEMPVIVRL